jgi:site-specific DNA-cytosine methylase
MLSNLEEMVKKPLRIGTLCSGTDMPTYVLGELCKHWSDYFGEEVSFVHKFSCEKAAHAQAFIAKHHQPEHIYTDIVQMGQNAAHELRSGTEIAVDEVDVLIGGTECDNYSALNFGTRATASGCFSSGSGTGKSGTTLEGFWQYIVTKAPGLILWENSDKTKLPDLAHLTDLLWQMGYINGFEKIDAKDYSLQSRPRIYMLAAFSEEVKELGMKGHLTCGQRESIYQTSWLPTFFDTVMQLTGHNFTLADFLLADDDEEVREWAAHRSKTKVFSL